MVSPACFSVANGDVEDSPAIDPIAHFPIVEKDGSIYVQAEESTIKANRRHLDIKCSPQAQERVVIIGGGSGAEGAIEGLRIAGFKGSVAVISSEGYSPIDRTKLSKALIADASKLALRDPSFYSAAGIEMISDEVTKIDFPSKTISTKSGVSQSYTKLILATGGTPKKLPLEGFKDLENIFVLRTVPDVQGILGAVGESKKKIVVIGTSFIGMEAGNALAGKGQDVTLVGMESMPLERVMGADVGKIFKGALEKSGVKFHMDAGVVKATSSKSDSKKVGAVHLKDGTTLQADLVVLGVGVAPATAYLKESTSAPFLEKDGSLKTTANFEVEGTKDVYAIGDIATFPYSGPGGNNTYTRIEHWNVAQNAGRAAAKHIVSPSYKPKKQFIPIFWSALGSQLRYCGNTPNGWDNLEIVGKPEEMSFAAFYGKGDQVVACATMGKDPVMSKTSELMRIGKMPGMKQIKSGVDVLSISV